MDSVTNLDAARVVRWHDDISSSNVGVERALTVGADAVLTALRASGVRVLQAAQSFLGESWLTFVHLMVYLRHERREDDEAGLFVCEAVWGRYS